MSVSAKFYLLFTGIYFSLVLFQAFRFLHPVKGLRIRLQLSDIFQMFSLYLYFHLQLKIDVLKIFANLIRKHLGWRKACNFIKERLQHSCFPAKFAKFLRTSFFTEHFRWLLLFTLPYLHLLAYTYLHLLIYT